MNRLSGLFTSAAFYMLFIFFGFESGDNPGPQPGNAARFLLTVFPFVLMLISLAFSFFINFKDRDAHKGETDHDVQVEPGG
jgi:GPH family glycoside/pentoside/hexuronide:cation symporter